MQINMVNKDIDYVVEGREGWKDGNLMQAIRERGLDVILPWPPSVAFQTIPGSFLVTMMKSGFSPVSCVPVEQTTKSLGGEVEGCLVEEYVQNSITLNGVAYTVNDDTMISSADIGVGDRVDVVYTEDETGYVVAKSVIKLEAEDVDGGRTPSVMSRMKVNRGEKADPVDEKAVKKALRAELKEMGVKAYGFESIEKLEEKLEAAQIEQKIFDETPKVFEHPSGKVEEFIVNAPEEVAAVAVGEITRVPVESSNLKSVGYDPDTGELSIEFHKGGVYQYADVPEDVHAALMEADSPGAVFHEFIKTVYEVTGGHSSATVEDELDDADGNAEDA